MVPGYRGLLHDIGKAFLLLAISDLKKRSLVNPTAKAIVATEDCSHRIRIGLPGMEF